ncbi:MAG TPA: ABC transporter ATP-binding protein [Candidatus Limnocylindrales bacterium]|nr:ABC transporter ATP-binding protein [Candidatus Limnocylindrales bacterium]
MTATGDSPGAAVAAVDAAPGSAVDAAPSLAVGVPPAPAIEVRGLVKKYESQAVLRSIDLEVRAGELVALLGPNGAGKTTTIEIIEGYRRADKGSVRVLGIDAGTGGPSLRARVGLMLQGGGLDPRSTPRDVVRLYAALHDGARDPDALIEELGLGSVAHTRVRRLSGGERQRLALALALVGEPEVLMLDEPTAGMDPQAKRTTRSLIRRLRDSGRAILLTTHDLADVERLADRVLILARGRIVAQGTPAELTAGAAPALRLRVTAPLAEPARETLTAELRRTWPDARLEADTSDPLEMTVAGADPEPWLTAAVASWAAANDVTITELRSRAATLEERYLELTGDRDVQVAA